MFDVVLLQQNNNNVNCSKMNVQENLTLQSNITPPPPPPAAPSLQLIEGVGGGPSSSISPASSDKTFMIKNNYYNKTNDEKKEIISKVYNTNNSDNKIIITKKHNNTREELLLLSNNENNVKEEVTIVERNEMNCVAVNNKRDLIIINDSSEEEEEEVKNTKVEEAFQNSKSDRGKVTPTTPVNKLKLLCTAKDNNCKVEQQWDKESAKGMTEEDEPKIAPEENCVTSSSRNKIESHDKKMESSSTTTSSGGAATTSPLAVAADSNKHLKVEPIKINLHRSLQQPQNSSPKITIKPIVRPTSDTNSTTTTIESAKSCESVPKLMIRVPPTHSQQDNCSNNDENCKKSSSSGSKQHNNEMNEIHTVPKFTIRSVVAPSGSTSSHVTNAGSNNHNATSENIVPKLTIKMDNTQSYNCEGGGTPTKLSIKKSEDGNKFTIVTNSSITEASPLPPLPKLTIKTNSNDLSDAMIVPNSSTKSSSSAVAAGQQQLSPIPKVTIKSIPKPSSLSTTAELTVPKLTIKSVRKDDANEAIPKFKIKSVSPPPVASSIVEVPQNEHEQDDDSDCMIVDDDEIEETNFVPKFIVKLPKENSSDDHLSDEIITSSTVPKISIKTTTQQSSSSHFYHHHHHHLQQMGNEKTPSTTVVGGSNIAKSHRSKDAASASSSSSSSSLTSEFIEPQLTVPKLTIRSVKTEDESPIVIPKVTIKSIMNANNHLDESQDIVISPKVTIKPIPKPIDTSQPLEIVTNPNVFDHQRGQDSPRIVLKISKKESDAVATATTNCNKSDNSSVETASSAFSLVASMNDEIPSSNQSASTSTTSSSASSPSSSSNLVTSTNQTIKNDLKRAANASSLNDDEEDVVEVKKPKLLSSPSSSSPDQNDVSISTVTSTTCTNVSISLISPQLTTQQPPEQNNYRPPSTTQNCELMPTPPLTQKEIDNDEMEIGSAPLRMEEIDDDVQIITNDNETSSNTVSSLSATSEAVHMQSHPMESINSMDSQPPQPMLCIETDDVSNSNTNTMPSSHDDGQDPLASLGTTTATNTTINLIEPTPPESQESTATSNHHENNMDKDVLDFKRELEIQMATPIKRPRGRPKKIVKVVTPAVAEENGIVKSKVNLKPMTKTATRASAASSLVAQQQTAISMPVVKNISVVVAPLPQPTIPVISIIDDDDDKFEEPAIPVSASPAKDKDDKKAVNRVSRMVNNDDDNSPTFHPTYRNSPRGGRGRGRGKRRGGGFTRGNKRTSLTNNESPTKINDHVVWTTPERLKTPISRKPRGGGRITSTPLQVFEEDTRMSGGDFGPYHGGRINDVWQNEESQNSIISSSSATIDGEIKKSRVRRTDLLTAAGKTDFSVDMVAEYDWPPFTVECDNRDTFMIQEQVTEYLGVKSFKRRYPDLLRRPVDMEERNYLMEKGMVSEKMCDLGLTAVHAADVLDIMFQDFHDKYEEYRKYFREKQTREFQLRQRAYKTEYVDKSQMARDRSLKSASDWNSRFNKDRTECRKSCMDLQNFVVQIPDAKRKIISRRNETFIPKATDYPVALVPGQYSENYRKYTTKELMCYPINTVLENPTNITSKRVSTTTRTATVTAATAATKLQQQQKRDDHDSSDSGSSSGSDSGSSSSDSDSSDSDTSDNDEEMLKCKVCGKKQNSNRFGKIERFVTCAFCKLQAHPSCIEMSEQMASRARDYNWQCSSCKQCSKCNRPAETDKMLYCDQCDRGHHIYCIGLRLVPQGRWHCSTCSHCSSCGSRNPEGNMNLNYLKQHVAIVQWTHTYSHNSLTGVREHSAMLCVPCAKLKNTYKCRELTAN